MEAAGATLAGVMTSTWLNLANVILADTGPLYALADRSDLYHRRVVADLRELTKEGRVVAIAYPTLAESYTLVMRRLGRAYSGSWLDEVLDGFMLLNPEAGDYASGWPGSTTRRSFRCGLTTGISTSWECNDGRPVR